MNKFLNVAILIFICFLTVYGQTDSTANNNPASTESVSQAKVRKDTSKSAIENIESIILDENVKEKLT
ncbi:MAG: hypothetical protein KDC52_08685, partial [Ignavibacteriae bacterium]|nr:hypothetical protein [Ignavibacteriota bacterium]